MNDAADVGTNSKSDEGDNETKPRCLNYCRSATATEFMRLEPVLHNKRSLCNEKPAHHNLREPTCSDEDPVDPKINKYKHISLKKNVLSIAIRPVPKIAPNTY